MSVENKTNDMYQNKLCAEESARNPDKYYVPRSVINETTGQFSIICDETSKENMEKISQAQKEAWMEIFETYVTDFKTLTSYLQTLNNQLLFFVNNMKKAKSEDELDLAYFLWKKENLVKAKKLEAQVLKYRELVSVIMNRLNSCLPQNSDITDAEEQIMKNLEKMNTKSFQEDFMLNGCYHVDYVKEKIKQVVYPLVFSIQQDILDFWGWCTSNEKKIENYKNKNQSWLSSVKNLGGKLLSGVYSIFTGVAKLLSDYALLFFVLALFCFDYYLPTLTNAINFCNYSWYGISAIVLVITLSFIYYYVKGNPKEQEIGDNLYKDSDSIESIGKTFETITTFVPKEQMANIQKMSQIGTAENFILAEKMGIKDNPSLIKKVVKLFYYIFMFTFIGLGMIKILYYLKGKCYDNISQGYTSVWETMPSYYDKIKTFFSSSSSAAASSTASAAASTASTAATTSQTIAESATAATGASSQSSFLNTIKEYMIAIYNYIKEINITDWITKNIGSLYEKGTSVVVSIYDTLTNVKTEKLALFSAGWGTMFASVLYVINKFGRSKVALDTLPKKLNIENLVEKLKPKNTNQQANVEDIFPKLSLDGLIGNVTNTNSDVDNPIVINSKNTDKLGSNGTDLNMTTKYSSSTTTTTITSQANGVPTLNTSSIFNNSVTQTTFDMLNGQIKSIKEAQAMPSTNNDSDSDDEDNLVSTINKIPTRSQEIIGSSILFNSSDNQVYDETSRKIQKYNEEQTTSNKKQSRSIKKRGGSNDDDDDDGGQRSKTMSRIGKDKKPVKTYSGEEKRKRGRPRKVQPEEEEEEDQQKERRISRSRSSSRGSSNSAVRESRSKSRSRSRSRTRSNSRGSSNSAVIKSRSRKSRSNKKDETVQPTRSRNKPGMRNKSRGSTKYKNNIVPS